MQLSPQFWDQLKLHEVELPQFTPVRQRFPDDGIADVPDAVQSEMRRIGVADRVRPGMRLAITAGSRGINRIDLTLRGVVDALRSLGAEPFVVPAMGSHGGATVDGQLEVLASYGITESSMGCPILATMEAVPLGVTPSGYTAYCDRFAYEADGIVVVNRVKPHSILTGDLGSGLMKMLGIGLGKAIGADAIHIVGVEENLIPAARIVLSNAKVLFGMAIVENSFDQAARIEAVWPDGIEETDVRLLRLARAYLPNIPFDPLDVLVVQQMGKNFSGTGMDPNVIGMHRRIGGPPQREIRRIVALRLSEESHGNSTGLGLADIITEGLLADVDYEAMCINSLTSDFLWGIKQPLAAPSEEMALQLALRPFPPESARAVIISDTAHLDHMWVSDALVPDIGAYEQLEALDIARPARFADGVLHLT